MLTAIIGGIALTTRRPRGRRRKVLIEASAFSSDRYAVAADLSWRGLDPRTDLVVVPADDVDLVRLAGWWGNDPDTHFAGDEQVDFAPARGARVEDLEPAGGEPRIGPGFARDLLGGHDASPSRALAEPHRCT